MPGYLLAPCPDGHSGNAHSRSGAASVHSCLVPSSAAYPLASHLSSSANTYNGLSGRQYVDTFSRCLIHKCMPRHGYKYERIP